MNIQPTLTERQKFLLAHEAAMAAYTGPITVIDGFQEIAPKKFISSHYDITPESNPERFRPIPGFKYYLCRDDGRVWSTFQNDYLTRRNRHSGRVQLSKRVDGKIKLFSTVEAKLAVKIWGRNAVIETGVKK